MDERVAFVEKGSGEEEETGGANDGGGRERGGRVDGESFGGGDEVCGELTVIRSVEGEG